MKKVVFVVLGLVILAGAVVASRTSVPPGHALLVRSRLGGGPRVLSEGNAWAPPGLFVRHLYPLGPHSDTLALQPGALRTADSEPFGLDLLVSYEISAARIPDLDRVSGGRYRQALGSALTGLLRPLAESRPTLEVFETGGLDLAQALREAVARDGTLEPYAVSDLGIAAVRFDPATERELVRSSAHQNSGRARIAIVGVDGADWDIIDPMIEQGDLPNFAYLIRHGTRASLESIQPMLSPRIWTSIATGKSPEEHGITDFLIKDRTTGKVVPITSNLRRSRALWNILSEFGMPVGFVGWLATWPAEAVDGFMVSDRMAYYAFNPDRPLDASSRKTYPDELFESLRPLVMDESQVGYDEVRRFLDFPRAEYDRRTAGGYDPEDPIQTLRLIYATTETYRKIGLRQMREPVRLFGLYFELVDAVSHLFIRFMPPRLKEVSDADYARFRDAVFETYRYQDEILGEILKALDENTILLVLSDHGFRTGADRFLEDPIGNPAGLMRIGHGGRAARAVLDHAPWGILLLHGPGIREGAVIDRASVMDIAPTVLYLLGLPAAWDMPGRVLVETAEPEFAASHPVLRIATYETGERKESEAPIASADDQAMMEKLAALGYIDRGGTKDPAAEGLRLLRQGKPREAAHALEKAVEAAPRSAPLWTNLGIARLKSGDLEGAQKAFEKAIEIQPAAPVALANLAMVLTERGRDEAAVQALEKAVGLAPDNAEMHDNLGVLYVRLDRQEDARREFQRAIELDPRMPQPYNNLGAVALSLGDYSQARAQFEKALVLSPGFPEAHLNLGRVELEGGRAAEAVEHLERVLEIDPEQAEALCLAGRAYRDLGRTEDARKAWRKAADLDPKGSAGKEARRLLKE